MKRKVKAGITSLSLPVFIQSTASTTGEGLGGVTHSTSGLIAEYRRQGQSSWTSITLVSKTLGTYTSGGFVADGALDGAYEFDPPDAAVAAGASFVLIRLRGAANMLSVLIEIELDAVDYQTDAFGALKPTTAGRTLDVSDGGEAGIDLANVGSPTTTLNLSGVTIKTATDVEADTQDIQSRLPAALVGGRMASNAEVVGDKTGYSLTTAPLTAAGTAAAVWDALLSNYVVSGSFGERILRTDAASAGHGLKVTGAGHGAADIHELQPGVIVAADFATGAIDANAIAADAATEIATAVGTLQVLTDLVTMIVNHGTASARFSTSALQNAPSGGGGGGTGTGARTVTITVALSGSPVEGASVRLTKAAETYVGSTNASGVVTFNVDDGTWTVSITSPNATFAGASLVVDDDEAVSYNLTAISITPSPAGQLTGYWTCYSHTGVVESGASVTMQLVGLPVGSKGLALDNRTRTVTSNGSGVAQFTNLFPGCRYKVWRGASDNKAWYVTMPDEAPADPVELGSIYGDDE